MLRRTFTKALAGLGISSQVLGSVSAKSEEDNLRTATHKDDDKSDRKERYRTDAEIDYNPTSYYVVQLAERKESKKEVAEEIEKKNSRIESLIKDSKATTGSKDKALPEEIKNAGGSVRYKGTVYEPVVIETGDVPEKRAKNIVGKVNSGEYGV